MSQEGDEMARANRPRRNLQEEDDVPQIAHTGMGVKISLGTYRMFFVDGESPLGRRESS